MTSFFGPFQQKVVPSLKFGSASMQHRLLSWVIVFGFMPIANLISEAEAQILNEFATPTANSSPTSIRAPRKMATSVESCESDL
jgi:hypothetical protein